MVITSDLLDDKENLQIYKNIVDYGNDVDWDVLYSTYNVNDISSSSIKRNSNSSFNQVKDKSDALFFMNKKNAYLEFHYMQTEMEEREGLDHLDGTIYCHNISITNKTGTIILPLVICIASLKAPLCNDVDYYARKKAEKLFSIIEENIRYEVATMLLYGQMGMSNLFHGPNIKSEDGGQNDLDVVIDECDLEGGSE